MRSFVRVGVVRKTVGWGKRPGSVPVAEWSTVMRDTTAGDCRRAEKVKEERGNGRTASARGEEGEDRERM